MDTHAEGAIFVAGHRGMVGSALVRALRGRGHRNILAPGRDQLDLCDQVAVRAFFEKERPTQVFLAAARVGGIVANDTYRAEFIQQNLAIQGNVIHEAWRTGVKRLLFLGSSCIYPKHAPQPMPESALLTGPLEATNRPYALAKIAGIEMCDAYHRQYGADFRAAMPTNLYGPGDHYDPQTSHVIPALLRKFHEAARIGAKAVTVWGSGTPRREFLHVDDAAGACLFLMDLPRSRWDEEVGISYVNVGCGQDVSIAELAALVARVVGFQGEIVYDRSKPDGTPRKLLDVGLINRLGWQATVGLEDGLRDAYAAFRAQSNELGPHATRASNEAVT